MRLPYILHSRCCKALLPFLLFISFNSFAQKDNLKNLVQTDGPEKIIQLEKWFNNKLYPCKPDTKIALLNQLEKIAFREDDKITQASVIFYRGLYVIAMDNRQPEKGIAMMQKAIAMAEKKGQQLQVGYLKHSLGYYYFTRVKNPVDALRNMLQAHYIFDNIGYENTYNQAAMLDRLGFVYYHLSNYNEALKYFKRSLKYPMENSRRHIGILNSIGQSYRELVEPDSAHKYFQKSREKALFAHDTAWIGISSGDIGHLYINEKLYTRALPYMQEYYKCSMTVNNTELVVEALTGLGDIYLNSGKVDLAMQQLNKAETLLQQAFESGDMPVQNYVRKHYLFNTLAKAWDARGNSAIALDYLKGASKIKDSIERRAKLSKNTSILQMFEAEQANNRLQLLRKENQVAEIKEKLYIALGVLFAVIIVLLYSRQVRERKIQQQKESLLNMEKEMAENELKASREQLEEYVRSFQQKAKLLEKAKYEMEVMRQQQQTPVEDEQALLNKLSLATILTEDDWTRFKLLFEKVHIGFFQKLKTIYPGLTPAETRLCSLIKLELNSHQMADMMGISVMSVKKNRQRLRKKIDLPKARKLDDIFREM